MIIDLSLAITKKCPIFKSASDAENAKLLSSGHIGTHLDTFLHKPIPLEWIDRSGILVDLRSAWPDFGPEIGSEALDGYEIRRGDFVILHTGFMNKHEYGTESYLRDHPQMAWSLIESLVEAGVSFIGLDAAGLRRGEEHIKADRFCEERETYVIENMTGLDLLQEAAPTRFPLRVAWFSNELMTGIPVKVVAVLPDSVAAGNRTRA